MSEQSSRPTAEGRGTSARVLVFPCGTEVGLEIHRSVARSTHFTLIGASSVPDHGAYVYERYIPDVPTVYDDAFCDAVAQLVDRHGIDLVVPAHDDVTLALAALAARGALAAQVVAAPLATCEVARSKRATYRALEDCVEVPVTYGSHAEVSPSQFPVFVKPDRGQGSRGAAKVCDLEELRWRASADPTLSIQEYLPGREFTVDCFTDRHRRLRYSAARERVRISNGISVRSAAARRGGFTAIADAINARLELRGAWFFQVKERSDGELVLMEMASRVAGTMGWSRARGVNLPLLALFDRLGIDVTVRANCYDVEVDRALAGSVRLDLRYEHVYIDFDDLLLLDGKVNTDAIAFIYQCRNDGVAVHLLTRHAGDLDALLAKHGLAPCFDEIIRVGPGESKADRIVHDRSIFIDDSHAERHAVHAALGIPVFDAHMIDALRRPY